MTLADDIGADYRRAFDEVGEVVFVRRYTGAGANRPFFDTAAKGRVTGYEPHELIGTIQQGDRKIILLAEDLIDAQFALPVTPNDRVVMRGKELDIIAADDSTRRVAGVLIAYELQVRG